jgi:hypothetical protein
MKRIVPLVILFATMLSLVAQTPQAASAVPPATPTEPTASATPVPLTVLLIDGRTVLASALRCDGKHVMARPMPTPVPVRPIPPSAETQPAAIPATIPMGSIEIGYPVSTVAKIEFPEPGELKSAPDLLLRGKATEALTQLGPVIQAQEPFRDIPGNWWVPLAQLKLTALLSLQRDLEAESLIQQLSRVANNPDAVWTAKLQKAAIDTRKKNYDSAIPVFDSAIAESKSPDILAYAWINKANVLLAKRAFEPALLAYLHIPVLYPDQKLLMPAALIGSAQAYLGLGDQNDAQRTLTEEASKYPDAPETAAAKALLEKFNPDNSTP